MPSVLVLQDPFTHHVEPAVEDAAMALLQTAGFEVRCLSRPRSLAALISKGFLDDARRQARAILKELKQLDPDGELPLVLLEPPELEALRQDIQSLLADLPPADARRFDAARSVEELLSDSGKLSQLPRGSGHGRVLLHPHCHEKAGTATSPRGGAYDEIALLQHCGYEVELTNAGCCGMGGTFGFEAAHYDLAQKIGALKLFPAIHAAGDSLVAATGGACRLHISQATHRDAEHPLLLAARALGLA